MTESNHQGALAPTGALRLAAVVAGLQAAELADAISDDCGRPLVVVESDGALAEAAPNADLLVIAVAPDGIDGAEVRRRLAVGRAFGLRRAVVAVLEAVARRGGPGLAATVKSIRDFAFKLDYREFEVVVGDLGGWPAALALAVRRMSPGRRPLRLVPSTGADGEHMFAVTAPMVPGRQVILLPSGRLSQIEETETKRGADADVGFRLAGDVIADAGGLIADAEDRPEVADQAAAHVLWLGTAPLLPSRPYVARTAAASASATVTLLRHRLNTGNLDQMAARRLVAGELGQVNLSFSRPLVFDRVDHCPPTAVFTLHESEGGPVVARGAFLFALRRATNIHWQALAVDRASRAGLKGQSPACLWLTGLSGSGKSTVASLLEKRLHAAGRHTYILDGDNVRHGLNRDLGFTDADRVENIRRVGEVAKLFVDAGLIVIVSFISPFRAERRMARSLFGPGEFLEVFVDTPLEVCEQRDPKGLYRKARAGELKNFTGIDSAYELPEAAEIRLDAARETPDALVEQVLAELGRRGIVDVGRES